MMSASGLPDTPLSRVIHHELQAIRGKWIWLVVLGISLVVLGIILLGAPVVATLATVTVLGVMIRRGLPYSGLAIVGLLVGISMIFRGISWLMIGFALKRVPRPAA